jgi:putative iron-only hydrogenase system regulator
MERRIASIIILIQAGANVAKLNFVLSKFAQYIIGRLGVNLVNRQMRIISLIVEAPVDVIGALSGQIGLIRGLKVKTAIHKT